MRQRAPSLIIVSGNRSGDLDSLITSYVKAKLLSLMHRDKTILVLRYFPETKWKLHRDAAFLLKQCGADLSFFESPQSIGDKIPKDDTALYLTDHNDPESELKDFNERIVSITDHHKVNRPIHPSIKTNIANTGSCSTLIAEEFFNLKSEYPGLMTAGEETSLAEMLYFTIRTDTDHLTDLEQYDLERDRKALTSLKHLIKKDENFFSLLASEKYNFEGYNLDDHLERDFKFWKTERLQYGISTIHCSSDDFERLIAKNPEAPEDFMKKMNLKLLFLMHFSKEPILKRELTVISPDSDYFVKRISGKIEASDLFQSMENKQTGLKRFYQKNPNLSRKKIQPFLDGLILQTLKENQNEKHY